MYFNNFPQIQYDPTGSGNFSTIQDIMTRIKVRNYIKNNTSMFARYSVPDGEPPEMVAFFSMVIHHIIGFFYSLIKLSILIMIGPLVEKTFKDMYSTNMLMQTQYITMKLHKVLEVPG